MTDRQAIGIMAAILTAQAIRTADVFATLSDRELQAIEASARAQAARLFGAVPVHGT